MSSKYNPLTVEGREAIFRQDKIYLEIFCYSRKTHLVDFFPNNEEFPPQGLTYVFSDGLGGFSIEGIKNILEERISEER